MQLNFAPLSLSLVLFQYSPQSDQASVKAQSEYGEPPNLQDQVKAAVRDVLSKDFNLTRVPKSMGSGADGMLGAAGGGFTAGGGDSAEYPLHEPTGDRTRETFDFTSESDMTFVCTVRIYHVCNSSGSYHVGLSCHDIQATQGARRSGVYLIHPPNLAQGPWRVFCDLETEGGGWIVFQVRDDVEPRENFMRGWEDYKVGFGDFDREFWLGEWKNRDGLLLLCEGGRKEVEFHCPGKRKNTFPLY